VTAVAEFATATRKSRMKVRFCSPIHSHVGYGELGRVIVGQLVRAGLDVSVLPIALEETHLDFGDLGRVSTARVREAGPIDVNIVSMIPPLFAQMRVPGAKNIGFTMFEADRLPDDWVADCNRMDAIWVPSEWVREVFEHSGVTVPMDVVGVEATDRPVPPATSGEFRLLSIFHWSARKNPAALLRAYCAAFDGRQDTVLVIKAHLTQGDPQQDARLRQMIASVVDGIKPRRGTPRIELLTRLVGSEEIRALHAGAHAYVSLSHGEGWGLPAWESALHGKPVLHTGWSAPNEFVSARGQLRYNLAPVYGMTHVVPFYDTGMSWAEPHLDDAVDKLRDLHAHYGDWVRDAQAQRESLLERYSPAARQARLERALGIGV
jgi:hypothetical protein